MTARELAARAKKLSAICLALPEAEEKRHNDHAGYLVRGKTFAWYLANHHGDGIWALSCKVLPGDNHALTSSYPARFYLPAYMAHRGWVALRLDLPDVDWAEVAELVQGSYRLTAPKTLVKRLPPEPVEAD